MTSNLLAIGGSGAAAATAALDVTGQNIANVGTTGYVERSVTTDELAGTTSSAGPASLFGVSGATVARNVDPALQADARRTASAAASADLQVTSLTQVQGALEQTNLYPAVTAFQSALQQLAGNPVDPSLRASALSAAQNMAQTFNLASTQIGAAQQTLQSGATANVSQMNQLATGLAALNVKIAGGNSGGDQTALLDKRDALLTQMSQLADITTTTLPDQTVQVQMGGSSGPQLVNGGTASTLAMATAADGTISFTLGGSAISLAGGSLAGAAQSLSAAANTASSLDTITSTLISAANAVQGAGVALDGTSGQPLFSGNSAAFIAVSLTSGDQLATAPAGAGANSLDPTNLTAMQAALPATRVNALLTSVSGAVQNATTSQTALDAIAANAQTALQSQSGVNLDSEATKLLQYQQAYQASAKVIETAQTIFTSLLQYLN